MFPTGKALEANKSMEIQAKDMQRSRSAKDAQDRESALVQATALSGVVIGIQARASGEGRLFGSVGPAEIVAAIAAQKSIDVDHHKVQLAEHIKEVGSNPVTIVLFDDVTAELTVEVIAQ